MTDDAPPLFSEAFAPSRDGAGIGFVLSSLARRGGGPVLWVQERRARLEGGAPCAAGLSGLDRTVMRLVARDAAEALWAMEEGLGCSALSAVIGEVWGAPRALDFTATKRLALRARRSGVPLWLLRSDAAPDLSVAPRRWRLASLPSAPHPFDARAPGAALWRAELFRARDARPGTWIASAGGRVDERRTEDRPPDRVDLDARLRDGPVGAPPGRRPGLRAVG